MTTPTLTDTPPTPPAPAFAAPAAPAPANPGALGRAALIVAIVGAVGSVGSAIASALLLVPQVNSADESLDPASRLALALGVTQLLWLGVAAWGVLQGIVAAVIDRGRRDALIATAVGVIGPLLASVVFLVLLVAVAPA